MVAQLPKRSAIYSSSKVPGNVQGQVERGSEQPDLNAGIPTHDGGIGLRDL